MKSRQPKDLPTKKEQTEAENSTDIFLIFALMIALSLGAALYFGALTPPASPEDLRALRADILRGAIPDALFGSEGEQ